jgi:hypothetical protein
MGVSRQPRGGLGVGKTKMGKGTKWLILVDGQGNLLGASLDSASSSEVTLLAKMLDTVSVGHTIALGVRASGPIDWS